MVGTRFHPFVIALTLTVAACATGTSSPPPGDRPIRDTYPADGGSGVSSRWDSGTDLGAPPAEFSACAEVTEAAAERTMPADIIWVIDSSGSMAGEARIVQDNMNGFAAAISASGIDYRVVVITDRAYVSVPAPLGTDSEHFRFIHQPVASHHAFAQLEARFSDYADFLRPGAKTHIVVVTDDESNRPAAAFRESMESKLGREFVLHAVASEAVEREVCGLFRCEMEDMPCIGPNGDADGIGATYFALADLTEGLSFSICSPSWAPLFTQLAERIAVLEPLPCSYGLPDPPAGSALNPDKINVTFRSGRGSADAIGNVGTSGRCGDGGWYYDDPDSPSEIQLCPETCEAVERVTEGALEVTLGCDTIPG